MTTIENPIIVVCPSGHKFRVQAKADGLKIRCPTCKVPVTVRRGGHATGDTSGESTDLGETNTSSDAQHASEAGSILKTSEQINFLSMDLPPQLPTGPPFPVVNPSPQAVANGTKAIDSSPSKSEPVTKQAYAQAAVVLLGLLLAVEVIGFVTSMRKTRKWDYKIESPSDINFESAVARMGDQGWELIFARRATSSYGSAGYEMIFKRQK